jgi:hypothetical protein
MPLDMDYDCLSGSVQESEPVLVLCVMYYVVLVLQWEHSAGRQSTNKAIKYAHI